MSLSSSVGSFLKRATTLPKALKQINVGKAIRQTVQREVSNVGGVIRDTTSGIKSIPSTVQNLNEGANAAKQVPMILGLGLVAIVVVLLASRRRG